MNGTKVSVPLVCLQYSEMTIEVTFRPIRELFTINNVVETTTDTVSDESYETKLDNLYKRIAPNSSLDIHSMYRFLQPPPSIELYQDDYNNFSNVWNIDVHMISNYCFLTKEESKVFALNEQKYLLKDIKYNIYYNLTSTANVKLESNALVSSWMWFFRRSDVYERNEWSNYTNWQTDTIPFDLIQGEQTLTTSYGFDDSNELNHGIGVDKDENGYSLSLIHI